MQAVILAGGKGERLGLKNIPKVMVRIGSKPLLQRQIELLVSFGITDIVLCVKHLSEKIKKYFGNGEKFGAKIIYSEEDDFLGTAGALKLAEDLLEKNFILLYGDIMLDMNLAKLVTYHKKKKGIATLVVHPSDHPEDSDIVDVDKDGRVKKIWRPKEGEKFRNLTNAAVFVFSKKITKYIPGKKFANIERDILPLVLERGEHIYAYETDEYIKDIGTPERLKKVKNDFKNKKIVRRPVVFLDRDGVINEDIELITKPSQIKLIKGSAEGLKLLKKHGFITIVVTNQPVVARNLCTEEDVKKINEKLKTMLAKKGAVIDAIYYCPHHPDKGYPEENPAYKIECECRKPKIGMLLKASEDFGFDLKNCIVVGDRTVDIQTGKNAGCRTILVKTGKGGNDKKYDVKPDYVCKNLFAAARLIIKIYGTK
jgi:histidinol-phosphate phosphatase family protein